MILKEYPTHLDTNFLLYFCFDHEILDIICGLLALKIIALIILVISFHLHFVVK